MVLKLNIWGERPGFIVGQICGVESRERLSPFLVKGSADFASRKFLKYDASMLVV